MCFNEESKGIKPDYMNVKLKAHDKSKQEELDKKAAIDVYWKEWLEKCSYEIPDDELRANVQDLVRNSLTPFDGNAKHPSMPEQQDLQKRLQEKQEQQQQQERYRRHIRHHNQEQRQAQQEGGFIRNGFEDICGTVDGITLYSGTDICPCSYAILELRNNIYFVDGEYRFGGQTFKAKLCSGFSGKVFVARLPVRIANNEVRTHFGKFGNVCHFHRPVHHITSNPVTYCFITFSEEETVEEVLNFIAF
ncbi:RNA-binding protein squid [Armadillidium vulgare]|nr:RNA-binding protein squid [Armadillidium vulgare]